MLDSLPFKPELELWQLAVELHVLLCCPKASARRRQNLCHAIGAQMVDVTLEQAQRDFPEELTAWRTQLKTNYPDYTWEAKRRISERFIEQHEVALRCGTFVVPLLSKTATGHYPSFLGRNRQPTQMEVARYVLQEGKVELGVGEGIGERGSDPGDIVHQFLKAEIRPWFPVAHLAVAFQLTAREDAVRGVIPVFDYQDTDFFSKILLRADHAAAQIRATPSTRGIANKLVSLEPFDLLRR